MLGGLETLIPGTVTEVVFVFLSSKPAFVLVALVLGMVARRRVESDSSQLLSEHS